MRRNILLFFMSLLPMLASAYTAKIDGIYYNFSGDEAEVTFYDTNYNSYSGAVVIPDSVTYELKTYHVTSIGINAFCKCTNLTSVEIPNSVTSLGRLSFSDCSGLKDIAIPNSVTNIADGTFYGCSSLTSINIPNGVTSIGNYTFYNCSSLTSIAIPNSVTSISDFAFRGCSSLTSIDIPNGVTSIGSYTFYGCSSLASIAIPNGVTSIGNYTFSYCGSLASITIPQNVMSIGDCAFEGCSMLASITIPNSVTSISGSAFNECNSLTAVYITDLAAWCKISFGGPVFRKQGHIYLNGQEIKTLIVPNEVTSIGNYAFSYCSSLTSVTIPNSVTSIGEWAFFGCLGLPSVTIPNNVTSIGQSAFDGCYFTYNTFVNNSTLTSDNNWGATLCDKETNGVLTKGSTIMKCRPWVVSVIIPEMITRIEPGAFYECKLHNLLIKCATPPASTSSFSEKTFYHTTLYIPIGRWDAYAYDDNWYKFINIRETAMAGEQVSMRRAYTLMDADTFAYSVYDPVNDCLGTISFAGINEDNPNHSWQVIEIDGSHYLYNVGAKKFVASSGNGSYALSDAPVSIDMKNGDNGIIIGAKTEKQWALVTNERMSAGQAIIDGINVIESLTLSKGEGAIYNVSGQRLNKMQKGINIKEGKKVLVK